MSNRALLIIMGIAAAGIGIFMYSAPPPHGAPDSISVTTATVVTAPTPASALTETVFWEWFQKNENELYHFEKNPEPIFDSLGKAMANVDPNLTFEFSTSAIPGKREFVITAAGVKSAFPKVESLFAAAPKFERWIIIKYRPRRLISSEISFGKKSIKAKDVRFVFFHDDDPQKIGIMLFLPGYRESGDSKDLQQIGYLFLDGALGEFDVETKVGAIVFQEETSKYLAQSFPLAELADGFDSKVSNRASGKPIEKNSVRK